MKNILVLPVLLLGTVAVAQDTEKDPVIAELINVNKAQAVRVPELRKKKQAEGALELLKKDTSGLLIPDTGIHLPKAKYSHSTARGQVYLLSPDNMPCLVPDLRQVAPMPQRRMPAPQDNMPNVIPKQRMIPKQNKQQQEH